LLVCADVETEEFAALYKAQRFLRHPSLVMLSLVLRGLITLSKTPEMARKMGVLLPDIMETLQDANTDVKMKALLFLGNMMAHMKREEASLIALQLAEKLLPLFDDPLHSGCDPRASPLTSATLTPLLTGSREWLLLKSPCPPPYQESSQVRELSISLFKDVMKTVVERSKKKMKKKVQRVLLPLFIRMNDQIKSVAKASGDTLLACAEFLRWRKLSYLAKTRQTELIGECLVQHDRSRVEEYVCQSLPYLKDAQASLREAAIRFIGLAAWHLRNLRREKLWDICNAILPLGKDPELSISFLAAKAIYVLTSRDLTSRWSLRWLCCWLC
ncbi:maestro heat-like repeat-containing protein family member 7, partial [Ciconia maguari]